jgi:aminoglycoside 2'-N-acetyltransferase I
MMDELERVICGAYELGALGTSEMGAGFYAARGWQAWEGSTWAVGPTGMMRTAEDDGYVYVLEVTVPLDLTSDLTCEWREGFIW